MELNYPMLRQSLEEASEEGTRAYENGDEFATCPHGKYTLERCAWETSWRIADFRRKELIPA